MSIRHGMPEGAPLNRMMNHDDVAVRLIVPLYLRGRDDT